MNEAEINQLWKRFIEKGYLLKGLTDQELDGIIQHYASKGFNNLPESQRVFEFSKEKDRRNADKVARIGTKLAWVAVGVGIVQIILTVIQIRNGK
jgi:hypothetical protein